MDIVWPSFDPWWRIWGGPGCPDWSLIPPARPPGSIWGIHHPLFSATLLCCYILLCCQSNRLVLYCSALLGWIGLGAVASDRGQRYCVKGFGVRKPLCLSPIYMQLSRWSWRGIEAQFSDRQPCLSSTYSAPFYQHTHIVYVTLKMYLPARIYW